MSRVPAIALVATLLATASGAVAHRGAGRLFHGGARPVTVGPAPRGVSGTDAEACADCHAEIAREWRGSQHANAWTDDVFQAAYAIEPLAFCRNCHAPAARAGTQPAGAAASDGVSCAVCHVRDGHVLGTGDGRGDAPGRRAPHPVIATRSFAESRYCAGCHQFNFPADMGPARGLFATDEPMQDTFEEWSLSAAAARGTQCQGCHMPWRTTADGRRYRSHAFPGGRDRDLLARAVRVTVSAEHTPDAIVVRATVEANELGHAFPTGDLFRRAELVVWVDGREAEARAVPFARDFANVLERTPRGSLAFVRRQSSDSRIPPAGMGPAREITLRLPRPADAGTPVRWALDHLLMPTPLAASQGFGEPRNRTRVLSGTVVPGGALGGTP